MPAGSPEFKRRRRQGRRLKGRQAAVRKTDPQTRGLFNPLVDPSPRTFSEFSCCRFAARKSQTCHQKCRRHHCAGLQHHRRLACPWLSGSLPGGHTKCSSLLPGNRAYPSKEKKSTSRKTPAQDHYLGGQNIEYMVCSPWRFVTAQWALKAGAADAKPSDKDAAYFFTLSRTAKS